MARAGLKQYVHEINFLELVAACENPLEAMPFLQNTKEIDLIFLDIQMPKMNGIDFLKSLNHPPLVIITTAYPSFALEGFQLDVLDYLVKPITFQRFFKAVNKAQNQFNLLNLQKQTESKTQDYFFIKCDQQLEKIRLSEIMWVEAMQNYVQIHTTRGKFTTLLPLKSVASELPTKLFIQTHRSYIVSLNAIESIEGNLIKIGDAQIPISRSLQEQVKNQIINDRLLKK